MKRLSILLFCLLVGISTGRAQSGDDCAHPDAQQADALYNKGKKANETGKTDSVIVYMSKARNLYEKAECWEKVVQMTRNLCVAYEKKQLYKKKQEAIVYGLLVAQLHLPDSNAWKGKMYRYVGADFLAQNSLDSAKNYLQLAQQTIKVAEDWKEYVAVCKDLARVAYFQEQFPQMEQFLNEAFDYNKRHLNNDKEQIKSIFQLYGALYYRTGAYERALEKHLEGLEYAQNAETRADSAWLTIYYNNIGLLYMEIGDIYKTQDYCENALYLAKQLGNYNFQVTAYLNLAEFFREKGQYQKASEYYQNGLVVLAKMQEGEVNKNEKYRAYINLNNGLAEVSPKIQQLDTAKAALLRNLKMHRIEPFRADETYRILGETYILEENYPEARLALEQSLQLYRRLYPNEKYPDIAHVYQLMSQIEARQGNADAALQLIERSEQVLRMEYKVDGGETVKIISDKRLLLQSLFEKAKLQYQSGQAQRAEQTIEEAVQLIEEMRTNFKAEGSKLFLLQQVIPIYEFSIGLSLDLYTQTKEETHLQKAFHLVELSKAMLLLDALKTEEARRFGDIPDELLEEENRLSREIAKAEKKLSESQANNNSGEVMRWQKELLALKREKVKLEKTLEDNPDYKKYYELKYAPRVASLPELQEEIAANTVVVEFFIGNEFIYIFNIYKDKVSFEKIAKDNDFEQPIFALRQSLTDLDFILNQTREAHRRFCTNAHALYERCLAEALKPQGIERLVVIPDGLLNYIPFEVLLPTLPDTIGNGNFKNLDYLIRHYTVHYHYSASLMLFERKAERTNGRILAFAPHYPKLKREQVLDTTQWYVRSNVDELPGATSELEHLSRQFYGDFYYNENANERRFKELAQREPYSVIHLAMHGWINNERPQYSNLVFSYTGDSTEDDLLHAYELNLLRLGADLVVLSACETGFGKYERGEGVVSLGRGFMYAGVPSLLMTLWPINDQATTIIMDRFYSGLADGLPKDVARREAQMGYIEQMEGISAHPFFWASFVTLGDESPIELSKQRDWLGILLYALMGGLGLLMVYFTWKYMKLR